VAFLVDGALKAKETKKERKRKEGKGKNEECNFLGCDTMPLL
jgi:hypothetical protein